MLALALCLCSPVQTTWYVDVDGTAPGTGSQVDPYTRVDYAVAQSTTLAGDTVLVMPGTYLGEAIDFDGKDLTVRGVAGYLSTILEAAPSPTSGLPVVRADSGESLGAVVEGFTLAARRGDLSTFLGGRGGGAYCKDSGLTLRSCRISASQLGDRVTAFQGGGVYVENGTALLEDCVVEELGEENMSGNGGGLFAMNATVVMRGSTFRRCRADVGFGLYAESSSLVVEDCSFTDMTGTLGFGGGMALSNSLLFMANSDVSRNEPGSIGAGIYAVGGTQMWIRGSRFENNRYRVDPASGAGIYMDSTAHASITGSAFRWNLGQLGGAITGAATIDGCLFENNQASGGQQFTCGGGAIAGQGIVTRSVFKNNTAIDDFSLGGGALQGTWVVDHCTFDGNDAAENSLAGPVPSTAAGNITMSNSIVRGGRAPRLDASLGTATYTNIEGGFPGAGNADLPESFWPDLALLPGSPSIDAADPASPLDPDGTRADRGAIPFDPFYCGEGCFGPLGTSSCAANPNSTGLPAELAALGDPLAMANRIVLNVTHSPSGSLGFFLASRTLGNQMLGGGSQGLLCLGGSVLRLSSVVLTDRGTGVVSFRAPLDDMPQGNVVLAGETWGFQYWFRDANPGTTSNTSSNVVLTFL